MVVWRVKRGRIYKTGVDSTPQGVAKTVLISATIRAIYDNDYHVTKHPDGLTPEEQKEALLLVPGLSAAEMESLIPLTGRPLAESIRAVISAHRATNRTDKDKNRPQ